MIVFDLVCREGHVAEAWFGSGADYEAQKARGLLACPVCDSPEVARAVAAPAVPAKSSQAPTQREWQAAVARLRRQVEAQCDYVGDRFAAEARARHEEGEAGRGVWGEASVEEVRRLLADDIPVLPLPFARPRRADN